MRNQKLVCIKFNNGVVIKAPQYIAETQVQSNQAHYVSKSVLRSYINTQTKLERNHKALENYDFSDKQDKNFIHKEDSGKTYAYLFRKQKMNIEDNWEETADTKRYNWLQKFANKVKDFFKPTVVPFGLSKKIVHYPIYQKFLVSK